MTRPRFCYKNNLLKSYVLSNSSFKEFVLLTHSSLSRYQNSIMFLFPFSDQSFVESFASRFFFLNAICAVCNFCFCLIIGISNVDNLTIKVYDFNWKQFVQKLMIQSFKILKNHGIFLLSFQMYLNFRAKNAQYCKIDFFRDF